MHCVVVVEVALHLRLPHGRHQRRIVRGEGLVAAVGAAGDVTGRRPVRTRECVVPVGAVVVPAVVQFVDRALGPVSIHVAELHEPQRVDAVEVVQLLARLAGEALATAVRKTRTLGLHVEVRHARLRVIGAPVVRPIGDPPAVEVVGGVEAEEVLCVDGALQRLREPRHDGRIRPRRRHVLEQGRVERRVVRRPVPARVVDHLRDVRLQEGRVARVAREVVEVPGGRYRHHDLLVDAPVGIAGFDLAVVAGRLQRARLNEGQRVREARHGLRLEVGGVGLHARLRFEYACRVRKHARVGQRGRRARRPVVARIDVGTRRTLGVLRVRDVAHLDVHAAVGIGHFLEPVKLPHGLVEHVG